MNLYKMQLKDLFKLSRKIPHLCGARNPSMNPILIQGRKENFANLVSQISFFSGAAGKNFNIGRG